jgi:hypothetical protein
LELQWEPPAGEHPTNPGLLGWFDGAGGDGGVQFGNAFETKEVMCVSVDLPGIIPAGVPSGAHGSPMVTLVIGLIILIVLSKLVVAANIPFVRNIWQRRWNTVREYFWGPQAPHHDAVTDGDTTDDADQDPDPATVTRKDLREFDYNFFADPSEEPAP